MAKYLACYDYGQGGLWIYIHAESREEIEAAFGGLDLFDVPPPWWTEDIEMRTTSYRLGDPVEGLFLEKLKR